jgi:hypothetical protein
MGAMASAAEHDRPQPQSGDVVIVSREGKCQVSVLAQPAALVWEREEDALAFLRPYAASRRLDIWTTKDGQSFDCIVRHRSAASLVHPQTR